MSWSRGMKYSFMVLVLTFLAYGVFIYLAFWPVKVFEFVEPVSVRPQAVHAGDVVYYRLNIIKHLPIHATVSRQLVNDKYTINLGSITSNVAVGAHNTEIPIRICADTPSGLYKFRWSGKWSVNWVRDYDVVSETKDWVEVLP